MGALAAASAGSQVLGSAISAISAINQGDYQAQVAQNNAQIARQNATNAYSAGAASEQQTALRTRAQFGAARAAAGSSGLNANIGSPASVQESIAGLGALSGQTIRNNAAREAYGYQTQANAFEDTAAADKQAGTNSAITAGIGLVSSLAQQGLQGSQSGLIGSLQASGATPTTATPGPTLGGVY